MLAVLLFCAQAAPSSARAEGVSEEIIALSAKPVAESAEEVVLPETELSAAEEEEEAILSSDDEEEWPAECIAFVAFLCNVIKDLIHFDINNTDPSLLSIAHYFSGYFGQLVFFGNWANRRSGSFGRLMGLYGNDKSDPEIVKHEHGHFVQYQQLGLIKYIFAIALPSIANDPRDYYSQPWEVTADIFGGVTSHYHSPGSEEAGMAYLENVKKAGTAALIASYFFG